MSETIGHRVAHGAALMVLVKFMDRGLGLISTLVLARVLVPADFGLVAMATAVIALIELISMIGLDVALIQKRDTTRAHFDTAWTLNLIMYTAMAALAAGFAHLAAVLYAEPRVEPVLYAIAASLLVNGFENIGIVAFRKELTFGKEFLYWTVRKLLAVAITLVLALTLRNYWALVLGSLCSRVIGVWLSYLLHPFRPRWSLSETREIMRVSSWVLLNSFFSFLNTRVYDVVLGRYFGPAQVGAFSVANELATIPTSEIASGVNRAVFPGYARLGTDQGAIAAAHVLVTNVMASFSVPAAVGVALTAQELVPVLLGPQWPDTVPLLQVLPFAAVATVFYTNNHYLFLACGLQRASAMLSGVQAVLLAVLVPTFLYRFGAVGAAYAALTGAWVSLAVSTGLVARLFPAVVGQFLGQVARPALAAAAMAAAVLWVRGHLWTHPGLPGLLALVATGVAVYALALMALWSFWGRPDGAEKRVLGYIRNLTGRHRAV